MSNVTHPLIVGGLAIAALATVGLGQTATALPTTMPVGPSIVPNAIVQIKTVLEHVKSTSGPVRTVEGLAVHGYDVVAYHTVGEAREGSLDHSVSHDGATYRFASAENQAMFLEDPERYAPAFGGFCAFAAANGGVADGNPMHWRIVEGQLYLNVNARAQELWEMDVPGNIDLANTKWPGIIERNF